MFAPPRPLLFCFCLQPEHKHLLLCHLLLTRAAEASLPLPLPIGSKAARFLALASPLLPCLNTEQAPKPLGNGGGSRCFLHGAGAVSVLRFQAGKCPPLSQGRKL